MTKLTDDVAKILAENDYINFDDTELYAYGLRMFIFTVGQLLLMLLIALIFGKLPEVIIYLCLFIPVRIFGGGYHAGSRPKCFALSMGVLGVVIAWLHLIPHSLCRSLGLATCALAGIAVFAFAPVAHKNKPLSQRETKVYGLITQIIIILEIVLTVGYIKIFNADKYICAIAPANLSIVFSIIAAKIKEKNGGEA